jgi:putative acetyltransferase
MTPPRKAAPTIRPFERSDLDAVAVLWLESWLSAHVPVPRLPSVEGLREYLLRGLGEGWTAHVAETDGALAGWLALEPAARKLREIFVAPPLQRRGIGKALLSFAKDAMPDGFRLSAAGANRGACRFYEREGLVRGAREPHERWGWHVPSIRYDWRPR